jgi:hypothetical protein
MGLREVDMERIQLWIQIIATAIIVGGLWLVILELRQNRELAQSQLTSDGWSMALQYMIPVLGESPADALVKACESPGELTSRDLEIVATYYSAVLAANVQRLQLLDERGSFVSKDYWRSRSLSTFELIFSSPTGRVWWRGLKHLHPDVKKHGDEILHSRDRGACNYDSFKQAISEEVSGISRDSGEKTVDS